MTISRHLNAPSFAASRRWMHAFLLVSVSLTGCAAFHPIRGVPAPYVPPEYLGPSRSGKKTIDLSLLVQTPPDQYRVAARDTLSIYIPGVLGSLNVDDKRQIGETPPINLSNNPNDPPTIGYPITVRGDGTISLPYVDPINVHGMTLPDIEIAIRKAYTEESNILNGERDRVLVSMQRRREVSVIVVRQETSSELTQGAQAGTLNIGNSKRGTARTVRLPAYENDVLHALANSQQGSDGLPGLDAKNTIYIIRRKKSQRKQSWNAGLSSTQAPIGFGTAPPVMGSPQPPAPPAFPAQAPSIAPQAAPSTATPSAVKPPTPPQPLQTPEPPPLDRPSKPVPRRPSTPQQTTPAPVQTQPQPIPEPQQPQLSPTSPTSGSTPVWPAPAQPPSSIQRTSGRQVTPHTPTAWPTIRGQSPTGWSWGHSEAANMAPAMSPDVAMRGAWSNPAHTLPTAGYGHGSFGPTPDQQPQPLNASMGRTPIVDPSYGAAYQPMPSAHGGQGLGSVGGHDNSWQAALSGFDPTVDNPNVIKIPIRLAEGERPTFTEQDIILQDGDIVFIESRETEVFYTGGLLGGGQYTLPRDYDLRVLEAISIATSPQNNIQNSGRATGGVSALNQDVTISASHVVILRSLPNGTRIPIEIDLYKAVRRSQENILIQPGDMVILQYTKLEAIGAFFERHLLEGALFGVAASQLNNNGGGN